MTENAIDRSRLTPALRILLIDHLNIACVLSKLRQLVQPEGVPDETADFTLLFFILTYLERFPEAVHHPKEDRFIFPPLLDRCPEAAGLLDSLSNEHREGKELLRRLRTAMETYRDEPAARAQFEAAAKAYIDSEFAHMDREERELVPLAQKWLVSEDWKRLNQEFRHADPLFEEPRQREFENLFRAIMDADEHGNPSAKDP